MLNRVILMGRIAQDLELKQTPQGVSVLSFSIAVDRNFVKQGEERQADFIDCVAWRQQAEFINRYFGKGRMIAIEGNLRKRVYEDRNGVKHYVTEVYVDSVSFTGERAQQGGGQGGYPQNNYGGGYQNNGGYGGGYQQNQGYQNPAPAQTPPPSAPAGGDLNIGDMAEFEGGVLSDDEGVPF
ncbi:MAG: single-stranded DNA-binding protein [Ruminococcus sp.]|nr:single-stranded DNA-binding protein [Ruminococcus sp.]